MSQPFPTRVQGFEPEYPPPWPTKQELDSAEEISYKFFPVDSKNLKPRKFGCLMATVPPAIAKEITDWAITEILPEHLGPDGVEFQTHVTVAYGFPPDFDPSELKAFLAREGPIKARLLDASLFPPGKDGVPLKVDVESEGLRRLNAEIKASFPLPGENHPDYVPHVTVAHLAERGPAEMYAGAFPSMAGREFEIIEMAWSGADRATERIPLSFLPRLNVENKDLPTVEKTCALAEAESDGKGHGQFLCQCGKIMRQCRCRITEVNPHRVYHITDKLCGDCQKTINGKSMDQGSLQQWAADYEDAGGDWDPALMTSKEVAAWKAAAEAGADVPKPPDTDEGGLDEVVKFIEKEVEGWNKPKPPKVKSLPVQTKEGFTGRRQDSLGRERCYEGGKPRPCGPGETPAASRAAGRRQEARQRREAWKERPRASKIGGMFKWAASALAKMGKAVASKARTFASDLYATLVYRHGDKVAKAAVAAYCVYSLAKTGTYHVVENKYEGYKPPQFALMELYETLFEHHHHGGHGEEGHEGEEGKKAMSWLAAGQGAELVPPPAFGGKRRASVKELMKRYKTAGRSPTKVAWELDAIRNNRSDSPETLLAKVDEIGFWLAAQKRTPLVEKLQHEAHFLADELQGGSGRGGTRIVFKDQKFLAPIGGKLSAPRVKAFSAMAFRCKDLCGVGQNPERDKCTAAPKESSRSSIGKETAGWHEADQETATDPGKVAVGHKTGTTVYKLSPKATQAFEKWNGKKHVMFDVLPVADGQRPAAVLYGGESPPKEEMEKFLKDQGFEDLLVVENEFIDGSAGLTVVNQKAADGFGLHNLDDFLEASSNFQKKGTSGLSDLETIIVGRWLGFPDQSTDEFILASHQQMETRRKWMAEHPKEMETEAESLAQSILAKAANLPKAVVLKGIEKATALYRKMEEKYGKGWARTIVAVGVISFPTPFTMGCVGATVGLAHVCTKLFGKGQKGMEEPITMEQATEAAQWLVNQLVREMEDDEEGKAPAERVPAKPAVKKSPFAGRKSLAGAFNKGRRSVREYRESSEYWWSKMTEEQRRQVIEQANGTSYLTTDQDSMARRTYTALDSHQRGFVDSLFSGKSLIGKSLGWSFHGVDCDKETFDKWKSSLNNGVCPWCGKSVRAMHNNQSKHLQSCEKRPASGVDSKSMTVAIRDLVLDSQNLQVAKDDVRRGYGSVEVGPLKVYRRQGQRKLELANGYHRLVEAMERGETNVEVDVAPEILGKSLIVKPSPFIGRKTLTGTVLNKAGFTGRRRGADSVERCYSDGVPVPCNQDQPKQERQPAPQQEQPQQPSQPKTPEEVSAAVGNWIEQFNAAGLKWDAAEMTEGELAAWEAASNDESLKDKVPPFPGSGESKPEGEAGQEQEATEKAPAPPGEEITEPECCLYDPDPNEVNPETGVAEHARVGVPASSVPPPPKEIPRLPNLTAKEREVESRFADAYLEHADEMADEYLAKLKSREIGDAPNVFSTDDAKLLSPDYKGGNEEEAKTNRGLYNVAVHQTANALAKRAFVKYLDDVVAKMPEGERSVLVTSGGCASGKSYGISKIAQVQEMASRVGAVWDAAGEQNATENPWILAECKKRGIRPIYVFAHADPQGSWERSIKRAENTGRTVASKLHEDSYLLGAKNFKAFWDKNRDDSEAEFFVIDNSGAKPQLVNEMPALPGADQGSLHQSLLTAVKDQAASLRPSVVRGATIDERIWGTPITNQGGHDDRSGSEGTFRVASRR